MSGPRLFGLAHCDTVKRARAWLAARGCDSALHDFKKAGLPEADLDRWLDAVGWPRLINRAGSTWRKLDEAQRAAVSDRASARALALAAPSVLKRPVAVWPDGSVTVGFDPADWEARLGR